MHDFLWLLEVACFEPRYIMKHRIDILAWAFCGHARDLYFFFFEYVLSMSGGEEGVHGSLLLTDLSLLRSRPWRSKFLDLSRCLSDIFADSWRERRRESEGRSSRSFLEDAWIRRW